MTACKEAFFNILMTVPKANDWNAQLVLSEIYQMTFGVFDHLGQIQKERASPLPENKRPLAVQAYHPSEHINAFNHFIDYVQIFPELKIKERYGLNLDQLLARPSWEVKAIVERCKELNKLDDAEGQKVANDLKKLNAGLK